MKIYVVTNGSYSDYHIVAATLDKEKADKIAERYSDRWEKCRIEEYEDSDVLLKRCWFIKFKKGTSDVLNCMEDRSIYVTTILNQWSSDIHGNIFIHVAADTAEEAIKIAAEKRAEYLAQKEGVC